MPTMTPVIHGGTLSPAISATTAVASVTQKVFTAAEYPAMRPMTP